MDDMERLARAMQAYWWKPKAVEVMDSPELLYMHSDSLDSMNSVLRFRATKADLVQKIQEIDHVFHHKKCKFHYYPHIHGEAVANALRAIGFQPTQRHVCFILHVDSYIRTTNPAIEVRVVNTFSQLKTYFDITAQAFGDENRLQDDEIQRQLMNCIPPEQRARTFTAGLKGSKDRIGAAGIILLVDCGLGLLYSGGVLSAYRNMGVYSSLLKARIEYAKAQGMTHVGIFAREQSSALVVAAQGFRQCGEMIYWQRNQDDNLTS